MDPLDSVLRVTKVLPQPQCTSVVTYAGWMPVFMVFPLSGRACPTGRRVARVDARGREPEPGSTDQFARSAGRNAKRRGPVGYSAVGDALRRNPIAPPGARPQRGPTVDSQPGAPYLHTNACSTRGTDDCGSSRAVVGNARPTGRPRSVHGATWQAPSLAIRLTLPAVGLDQTHSWSPAVPGHAASAGITHTGVRTAVPSRRKVVSSMYRARPSSCAGSGRSAGTGQSPPGVVLATCIRNSMLLRVLRNRSSISSMACWVSSAAITRRSLTTTANSSGDISRSSLRVEDWSTSMAGKNRL